MRRDRLPASLGRALGDLLADLRTGARRLVRERAASAIAVLVFALGIGAVTTQFAVVNGVLLRGFSFPDADRLVTVELARSWTDTDAALTPRNTPADFLDIEAQQTSFETMAAWLLFTAANVSTDGATERRQAGYVTHDFFRMLGVRPALGRDFTAEDDRDGAAPAVMLSDALWRSAFAADPGVIGRPLRVNGRAGTVIGVMPRGFAFPWDEQLWIPLRSESPIRPRHERANRTVTIYARLKPGVTMAQASAEAAMLAERLARRYPENAALPVGRVRPLIASFVAPGTAGLLYTLLAFSVGVLLIACVNVSNLQLARGALRIRELATRASLGATGGRLLRQLLAENLLLAVCGATLGTLLALGAVGWLDGAVRQFRPPLPGWMRFSVDAPVLGLVVAAAVVATLAGGSLPGWSAARTVLTSGLAEGGRSTTSRRAGILARSLVVFQIVVTSVLLVGSLLQLRSILRQQHLDHGYDATAVMTARYMLMAGEYPDDAARAAFNARLLRELRAHPSLESAALTERYRMIYLTDGPVEVEGQPRLRDAERPIASSERVTDGYFATLGQRLLAGRDFREEDGDLALPVAIVNASFARRHFPAGDAVGRRFRPVNPDPRKAEPWRLVVGVVSDVRMAGPFAGSGRNDAFYLPFTSSVYTNGRPAVSGMQFVTVVVRPRGRIRPEACLGAIRESVAKLDAEMPLFFVGTPEAQFEAYLGQTRLITQLSLAVGLIAIALASAGLYSLTSQTVSRRLKEFGIRLALGAARRQVLALVLRQAGRQVVWGLAIGLSTSAAIAAAGRASIARTLFEADPLDPLVYGGVAALLGGVATLAALLPARRATVVEPVTTLRSE